jgi:hypothetical protein
MTPLHSLITTLVRLLGLYFSLRALDSAAEPLFTMLMQLSMTPDDPALKLPNPWLIFLPMVAFYIVLAAVIFFTAPRIARLMIGAEAPQRTEVPWHETLLFSTGALIVAWAFVRLTDTAYRLVAAATNNHGRYSMDSAMMVYVFMTGILLGAGVLLIARFHRISAWITARRSSTAQAGARQPPAPSEPERAP